MPSDKRVVAAVLVIIVLLLAGLNVWFTAARSLIPLELDGTVLTTEVRHEKHPGHDDVHLMELKGAGPPQQLQFDAVLAGAMRPGAHIHKPRFERELQVNEEPVKLQYSQEFRGMVATMIIAAVATLVLGASCFPR